MALGGLGSKLTQASPQYSNGTEEKKDAEIMPPDYDAERQGSVGSGRRTSRIAPPKRASIVGGQVGDADSDLSVGAQIELERENAIKYRTCSWRKV